MPINPEIALGGRPVQIADPLTIQTKALNLQTLRQQQQAGALALQEQQRQISEGERLRALFQETPDLRAALPKVYGINPQLGISMQKSLHEQERAAIDLEKSKIETNAKKAERFGSIAGTIKDEGSFHRGIAAALDEGLIDHTHAVGLLNQGWNEQTAAQVQGIARAAMTAKEQHAAALADLAEKRAALDEKHRREMEPFQVREAEAKATGATLQTGAQTLGAVRSQQEYDAWRQQNPDMAKRLPPMFSPAVLELGRKLGLTADQQAAGERAAATAAETMRHNRVMEGQGAQRIAQNAATPLDGSQPAAPDPMSQSILGQTGLSFPAFQVLTGHAGSLPRDKASRAAAMREAQEWSNKRGVDVSAMVSRYNALNQNLQRNTARFENVRVAEGELAGTLQNLRVAAQQSGFTSARLFNVVKKWAAGQMNDAEVQKYAFHLNQLQSELAFYNAAAQGRNSTEIADMDEAKRILQQGIAKGSIDGLEEGLKSSVQKMGITLQQSVDRTQRQIWDLFGVGQNWGKRGQQPAKAEDLSGVSTEELMRRLTGGK